MITLTITPTKFFYLQRAVKRDLETLEDMALWDIDGHTEEHADEVRLCKAMTATLGRVEQEQVIPH